MCRFWLNTFTCGSFSLMLSYRQRWRTYIFGSSQLLESGYAGWAVAYPAASPACCSSTCIRERERNKKLSRPSLIVASSGQFLARLRSHHPVLPPAACWLAAQDCCHLLLWRMLVHFFMICLPAPRSLVTTTLHKG